MTEGQVSRWTVYRCLSSPAGNSPHFGERVIDVGAFITLNVSSSESEDHIMRYLKSTATRTRLIALAAMLLATAQSGCVGYADYPSRDYSYSYHSSHPSGYYGLAQLSPILFP
jgi:hypothetical protein